MITTDHLKKEWSHWWLMEIQYTYYGHFTFKKKPTPPTIRKRVKRVYRDLSVFNGDQIGGVYVSVLREHRPHLHCFFISKKKPTISFPKWIWRKTDGLFDFRRILSEQGSRYYLIQNLYGDDNDDPEDVFTSRYQEVSVNDFDWYNLKLLKTKRVIQNQN